MIYFTSDTHFFHIGRNRKNKFDDYISLHNVLVDNWNKKISDNDDIYIIGDFSNENGYKKRYTLVQKYQAKERFAKGKVGQIFIDSDSMQPFLNSKKK